MSIQAGHMLAGMILQKQTMNVGTEREDQLANGLLDWLVAPSGRRGVSFFQDDGQWSLYSYAELAQAVRCAAATIQSTRSHPGGSVALVLPTGPEFIAAFFGALLAGDTPCPLAPPGFLQDPLEYLRYTADILDVARPSLLVSTPDLVPSALDALALAGLSATPVTISLDTGDMVGTVSDEAQLGLLQFTSGSSGRPRGARVTRENLTANIQMIRRWLNITEDDVAVSWLPLFHDMGLIGALLSSIVSGIDLLIMRPDQFIRFPDKWLACFGSGLGTLAVSPSFGFAYAGRRVPADQLAGWDFSRWRVALVAAERIDPGVLSVFSSLLSPYGFQAQAFLPAYGLAEATLAVTGGDADWRSRLVRIDWSELGLGRPIRLLSKARLGDRGVTGVGWLMGCGRPHPGMSIEILDERRERVPEGHLGEIAVAGPTIVDGYQGNDISGLTAFASCRELYTGDAGFLLDGELYVVGRIGDSLKVRGRSVYMEDIESRLGRVSGVSVGRCVALAGSSPDGDCVMALVEATDESWVAQVAAVLEHAVGRELEIRILQAARGTIQRTSSGKPRRRLMWQALIEGRLAARCVLRQTPELMGATKPEYSYHPTNVSVPR
jgi:acyl-CoA synthetase (AMP-forming)/AMP-acid ligase II